MVKHITRISMELGESIPIIEDFFHLTYIRNSGVAFGLMQGKLSLINIVAGVAVVCIISYLIKNKDVKGKTLEKIGFLLILAGANGNVIDRLLLGYVVDMFDFRGIWQYVFNVADAYINIGVLFIVIQYIREARQLKKANIENKKSKKKKK